MTKLEKKRFDKLMEIAVYSLQRSFFPDPVSAEDKRTVAWMEKERERVVRATIENALPKKERTK